jgi:hypothetical protein
MSNMKKKKFKVGPSSNMESKRQYGMRKTYMLLRARLYWTHYHILEQHNPSRIFECIPQQLDPMNQICCINDQSHVAVIVVYFLNMYKPSLKSEFQYLKCKETGLRDAKQNR